MSDYNTRLFGGGIRTWFHLARYRWLRQKIQAYYFGKAPESMLELGCYDGKVIEYLGELAPAHYMGFDANWEGGLTRARQKWARRANTNFIEVREPQDFQLEKHEEFDIAVSMETLEHLPPDDVDGYLYSISGSLDGYFFVTVPNEKGLFFLLKWLGKRVLAREGGERYTWREAYFATIGRLDKVERNQHKGFDWERLVERMGDYFDVVEVEGRPLRALPVSACFSVCIVAKSLTRKTDRSD